jgi:hypothetical protein
VLTRRQVDDEAARDAGTIREHCHGIDPRGGLEFRAEHRQRRENEKGRDGEARGSGGARGQALGIHGKGAPDKGSAEITWRNQAAEGRKNGSPTPGIRGLLGKAACPAASASPAPGSLSRNGR